MGLIREKLKKIERKYDIEREWEKMWRKRVGINVERSNNREREGERRKKGEWKRKKGDMSDIWGEKNEKMKNYEESRQKDQ